MLNLLSLFAVAVNADPQARLDPNHAPPAEVTPVVPDGEEGEEIGGLSCGYNAPYGGGHYGHQGYGMHPPMANHGMGYGLPPPVHAYGPSSFMARPPYMDRSNLHANHGMTQRHGNQHNHGHQGYGNNHYSQAGNDFGRRNAGHDFSNKKQWDRGSEQTDSHSHDLSDYGNTQTVDHGAGWGNNAHSNGGQFGNVDQHNAHGRNNHGAWYRRRLYALPGHMNSGYGSHGLNMYNGGMMNNGMNNSGVQNSNNMYDQAHQHNAGNNYSNATSWDRGTSQVHSNAYDQGAGHQAGAANTHGGFNNGSHHMGSNLNNMGSFGSNGFNSLAGGYGPMGGYGGSFGVGPMMMGGYYRRLRGSGE